MKTVFASGQVRCTSAMVDTIAANTSLRCGNSSFRPPSSTTTAGSYLAARWGMRSLKDDDFPMFGSTHLLAGPPLTYPVPPTADSLHSQPIRTAAMHP